jgi:hypothetical protein
MHSSDLSQHNALVASERVEADAAISCHNYKLTIVVGKSELSQLMMTLNLMSKNHSDSIVYVNRVAIVTHHSEPLIPLTGLLKNVEARVGNSGDIRDKVLTVSIVENHVSIGVTSECNVHKLRRELKMQHLNGKVLSSWVVKGNTTIDTASNEEIPRW